MRLLAGLCIASWFALLLAVTPMVYCGDTANSGLTSKDSNITKELTELIKLGIEIGVDLLNTYSPVPLSAIVDFGIKVFDFIDKRREGTRKVNQIFEQLSELNQRISYNQHIATEQGLQIIQLLSMHNERKEVQQLYNLLDSINSDYENNFVRCFLNTDQCLVKSKESFAIAYTTFYNNQARKRLEDVRRLIVAPNIGGQVRDGLFDIMIQHYKAQQETSYDCGSTRSLNQQIYHLYNFVIGTLIRGYIMVKMSYIYQYREELKQDETPIGWSGEWESILNIFKNDTLAIAAATQSALKRAAKDIRPCDPPVWTEGENYGRLIHFIEGYIANDVVLNGDHSCGHKCAFEKTIHYPYETFAEQIACSGTIRDCQETDINAVWVSNQHNHRRYNQIGKTEWRDNAKVTLEIFGLEDYTSTTTLYDDKQLKPVDKKGFLNINKCYMCKCYCDDYKNSESIRKISHAWVRPVTENAIVTGVRLRIVHKVLTIQIQEGVLVNGTIDRGTVRWVPVDEKALFNGKNTELLSYDERSIAFDDLELPAGSVVTGVAFEKMRFHHSLTISGISLDDGGNLSNESETLLRVKDLPRDEIELAQSGIPTLAPSQNKVLSRPGKTFVNFQATDWKKDAAQTTVPFFDYQDVTFDPVSPLGGVGLYYKGALNYGGFIGLKVMAPDYSDVIVPDKIARRFDDLLDNIRESTPQTVDNNFDA